MKWTTTFFALIFIGVFVSGCRHDIQLSVLRQSKWYKEQLEIVNTPVAFLEPSRSLWYGKVAAVRNGIVTLKPFRKLSGFSNDQRDSLALWFPEKAPAELSIGTWIATRTERSLKNQYFVQDYRSLTLENAAPEKFTAIYEKILLAALEHNWHLKVEVLDTGRMLKISNGVPRMAKFYEQKDKDGYTSTRTKDGSFFSGNVFEYTISDTKGILFDRIRLQNTPGGMVWEKDENDLWHVFQCGYDFDRATFHEITGEIPKVNLSEMIRFSALRESYEVIAKHPSTKARRDELQRAFDKAGIPGKWEIGGHGSMIFYSDCREFEVDMPWFCNNGPLTVRGPNPHGFIFSLSTPHTGTKAIPLYAHQAINDCLISSPPALCECQWFYYWKTMRYPGFIAWENGENMVCNTWNFEYGGELSGHTELLAKIQKTIRALPPWTLPETGK